MIIRTLKDCKMALLLAVVIGLCGWNDAAYGQGQLSTATLTGQVTDSSGAVVPNVQVSLQNNTGGVPETTTSNQAGYYRFSFLRPATYTLSAKMTGF